MINDPSRTDIDQLAHHWIEICEIVKKYENYNLIQTEQDIQPLQNIVNRYLSGELKFDHIDDLIAVAVGRILARQNNEIDWAVISDEYGTELTLRVAKTSLVINIYSIVRKRLDANALSIQQIFQIARNAISEYAKLSD